MFSTRFTWPSTVNVVEIIGAKPIFIDVSLENHCMDLSKLEETLEDLKTTQVKKLLCLFINMGIR